MPALLAEGTLYFNRLDINGIPTGRKKVIGVAQLEIKTNSDIKEQTSKDKGLYGQVTASIAIPKPVELSLTIQNFDRDSLAMALMGDAATLTVGGGTVTDEVITAKLGVFVPLLNRNLTSASVVVTNSLASTTYVEGTDYEVNYALGNIMAKVGGSITADQSLKVDYAHGAIDGWKVSGGTVPQIKGEIVLDGRNLDDGKTLVITVDNALLTSESGIDFMSDKFVEFKFKGRANLVAGKTSAFTVEYM